MEEDLFFKKPIEKMDIRISEPLQNKILDKLLKKGETSFLNLKVTLNLPPKGLEKHLQNLMWHGLISMSYSNNSFDEKTLYYGISALGRTYENNKIKGTQT